MSGDPLIPPDERLAENQYWINRQRNKYPKRQSKQSSSIDLAEVPELVPQEIFDVKSPELLHMDVSKLMETKAWNNMTGDQKAALMAQRRNAASDKEKGDAFVAGLVVTGLFILLSLLDKDTPLLSKLLALGVVILFYGVSYLLTGRPAIQMKRRGMMIEQFVSGFIVAGSAYASYEAWIAISHRAVYAIPRLHKLVYPGLLIILPALGTLTVWLRHRKRSYCKSVKISDLITYAVLMALGAPLLISIFLFMAGLIFVFAPSIRPAPNLSANLIAIVCTLVAGIITITAHR